MLELTRLFDIIQPPHFAKKKTEVQMLTVILQNALSVGLNLWFLGDFNYHPKKGSLHFHVEVMTHCLLASSFSSQSQSFPQASLSYRRISLRDYSAVRRGVVVKGRVVWCENSRENKS